MLLRSTASIYTVYVSCYSDQVTNLKDFSCVPLFSPPLWHSVSQVHRRRLSRLYLLWILLEHRGVHGSRPCTITSAGGSSNVLNLSGSNNGTLSANTLSFSGITDIDNVTIGSLTWADRNATGFDTGFSVTYTLGLIFTAPNADSAGEAFTLTVSQAAGNTLDQVSGLSIVASSLPGSINLGGVVVSDIHFSIQTGTAGSFSGDVWSVAPCGGGTNGSCTQTSTLLLTADFTAAPAPVPEPATLPCSA